MTDEITKTRSLIHTGQPIYSIIPHQKRAWLVIYGQQIKQLNKKGF